MLGLLSRATGVARRVGNEIGNFALDLGETARAKRRRPGALRADVTVDIGCIKIFRAENFPESGPSPWLDRPDAPEIIARRLARGELTAEQAEICRFWHENGYYVARGAIDPETIDRAWGAYEAAIAQGKVTLAPESACADDPHPGRYLNPHLKVRQIDRLLKHPVLVNFVGMVLGRQAIPFQTITSHKGSQQSEHSDSIHMTTYPLGYLAACWVAMEDIHPDSGPLVYYPGSHQLPYLLSNDVGITPEAFGERGFADYHEHYEPAVRREIAENGIAPEHFIARKGDVLFWHANLLHGGSVRKDIRQSRKALVNHYFTEGCVCYHDLMGKPSAVHGPAKNLPVCGAENADVKVRRKISLRRAS